VPEPVPDPEPLPVVVGEDVGPVASITTAAASYQDVALAWLNVGVYVASAAKEVPETRTFQCVTSVVT
jgi:hypothetical protein